MSEPATQTATAPEGYSIIKEGHASILFGTKNEVFYNKVQVLNRDLSIAVISYFSKLRKQEMAIKAEKRAQRIAEDLAKDPESAQNTHEFQYREGLRIFEALSATGLRSIRYVQEIPHVDSILVNDLEPAAVEAIKRNIEFNNIDTTKLIPNQGDASLVMYMNREKGKQFDVVDLDPYGSSAPFLDGAVQAVEDGGLLCVTCTDMPVLSGNNPAVCFARYGTVPYKCNYLHEMALRILLSTIETSANRYNRHVVPIVSCSIDFYVRIFVRVFKSPKEVKKSMSKSSFVNQCCGCDSFHFQDRSMYKKNHHYAAHVSPRGDTCDQCGCKLKMVGPVWNGPIHDQEAVLELIKQVDAKEDIPTKARLHGLLTSISEEVPDAPLYYTVPGLCKTLHCSSPKMEQIQGALVNAGYKVSQSHKVPDALKTDAPNHIVWDIMRCWVKKHPLSKKRASEEGNGNKILAKEPEFIADFTVPASVRHKSAALRFPQNPEAFWGPKCRAVGTSKEGQDGEQEPEPKKAKTN